MEYLLLAALVLAFPVIAIVALVKASNLRTDMQRMALRIAALEANRPAESSGPAPAGALDPAPDPTPPGPSVVAKLWVDPPEDQTPTPEGAIEPPPAPVTPPAPATPKASFEERFGTQWVVWIGGLALALGGVFLVRFSIEAGLIGPGVRVALGVLFAAALIAVGEWARRKGNLAGFVAPPKVDIPSILTAAGTMAAFATVYAAFALYGFLSAAMAFILLGLVALATLGAALLHGPALAGLGLVGAYVTPLLVSSEEPSYWALYLYLAIVTAAAFALARMRLWRWLAVTAVVFGTLWTFPGIDYLAVEAVGAHLFHVIAGFALAALLIVSGLLFGPSAEPGKIDEVSSGSIAAYLFAAACLTVATDHSGASLIVFALMTAATVGIAWRTTAALWALPAAALLTIFVMLEWAAPQIYETLVLPAGVTSNAIAGPSTGSGLHLALGAAFAALFGLAGFAALDDRFNVARDARTALIWSGTAVVAPIAILIALYYRVAQFDRSIPFAIVALLLAALYGYATELLSKRAPRPGLAGASAVFATGAVAGLALALTFALDKGWLTVALALMVPGIAWIAEQRPLPALRYLAAAIIALVVLRIGYEPRIVGNDIGTTPIFNWILYGYGVPALSFWTAGVLLRRRADDVPARMADSAAILFTVLLCTLEIRHYINNGDVFRTSTALAEIGMQVSVGLAITIGLERLRVRSQSVVHNIGALVIGGATFLAILFGLLVTVNPMFTGRPVGDGTFFNLVLLGYGIPAILAAILALIAQHSRPLAYRVVAATTAVTLAIAYLSLQIRTIYHGPFLARGITTDAEQYTYSATWLVFGVLLLVAGFLLRSQPTRMASAAVVALTIAKVFLIDMAGLTGIYRALSFIGLGVVLVGIGWLYQRLLFPAKVPPARDIKPDGQE
ncbi:MAG: DUF2339 domain-containing protein [Pseudolabrys sp.]|nr:DUF2339 domain-containing protein [Pseudolabrys sp.]